MNRDFYVNVAELMSKEIIPEKLPKPTRKKLMEDGEEIQIITVTCEGIEW